MTEVERLQSALRTIWNRIEAKKPASLEEALALLQAIALVAQHALRE